jgi:hypothetical protein
MISVASDGVITRRAGAEQNHVDEDALYVSTGQATVKPGDQDPRQQGRSFQFDAISGPNKLTLW